MNVINTQRQQNILNKTFVDKFNEIGDALKQVPNFQMVI